MVTLAALVRINAPAAKALVASHLRGFSDHDRHRRYRTGHFPVGCRPPAVGRRGDDRAQCTRPLRDGPRRPSMARTERTVRMVGPGTRLHDDAGYWRACL